MSKIKKNDTVMVMAGKDKGKSGKVLKLFPKTNKAIVEHINFVKRHTRRRSQEDQGGIIEREAPIAYSNLMVLCKGCSRPTRLPDSFCRRMGRQKRHRTPLATGPANDASRSDFGSNA